MKGKCRWEMWQEDDHNRRVRWCDWHQQVLSGCSTCPGNTCDSCADYEEAE